MKIFVLAGLSVLTALGFTLAAQSSLKMEFVNVPAGEFVMGCSNGDSGCKPDESPRHRVQVTKGFEIGKYEVTQAQWMAIMQTNPSANKGENHPVETVSKLEIQDFKAQCSQRRLPIASANRGRMGMRRTRRRIRRTRSAWCEKL